MYYLHLGAHHSSNRKCASIKRTFSVQNKVPTKYASILKMFKGEKKLKHLIWSPSDI